MTTIISLPAYRLDLARTARNVGNIVFTVGLPSVIFILLNSVFAQDNIQVGYANTSFYLMVSQAVYGGVVATVNVTSVTAMELRMGWGRQLALTPLRPYRMLLGKALVALTISAAAIAVLFAVGFALGARADNLWVWLMSFVLVWLLSGTFALYGLAIVHIFTAESAPAIAAGGVVMLSFFAGIFTPLSGTMLTLARFTPLFGVTNLARWPQLHGSIINSTFDGFATSFPLWSLAVNVLAWTCLFAALAVLLTRRGGKRTAR